MTSRMYSRRDLLALLATAPWLAACGGGAATASTPATVATRPSATVAAAPVTSAPTASSPAAAAGSAGTAVAAAATPAAAAPAASGAPVSATTAANTSANASGAGIKIGAVFSMTKGGAVYGAVQKNAVQLAMDEINTAGGVNGNKLQPLFEDDASEPKQAITVFEKLTAQDKVLAIIGPTLSNSAVASDPVAQQAKVPVLGVSNTAGGITEIGNFIFRDSLSEAQVIPNTIKVAKEKLGFKKVALIYGQDDAFTKAGYDVFKKELQANGIQILTEETFSKGDVDFSAQMTKIKGMNPDAIVASALANEAGLMLTQARKAGIPESVPFIGGNGFNTPAIIKAAEKAAEGTIVGAAWHVTSAAPKNADFVKNYKAKFNADPDQFAAQAYSGVYILADAIKRATTTTNGDAVRQALTDTKGVETPLGTFSFTPQRDANHLPVVQVVKNGKFELL